MGYESINWSRDKAIVTPEFNGAAYKQDGRYFNQQGERVKMPGEPPDPVPGKAVAEAEKPKPKSRAQRVREAREPAVPDKQKGGPKQEIDLRLWALKLDDPKYRFGLVSAAIREKYDIVPSGARGAIDALIANGVVTLDEAHKANPGMGLKD